ncbi:hypothetical protein BIU82_15570 [Arthrobacter sp. SW1]|uniref:hypothetical protein n=1 Tax=Arthrobacter sp. SW1 TaxID=1920889 RepID=UPI000877C78F|nr:hypothetical protein [Arthrobacter sp. SW1]OFI39065.1 hypothetical protein BIU82_15570 [Arthrobacter sp. SW1]
MSPRPPSGSYAWRRAKTVLAAGALAFLLALPAANGGTLAAWTDSEFGRGSFAAATIQRPVITSCTLAPGTLGANPVITLKWRFPAGSSYAIPANVNYYVAKDGLLTNLTSVLLGSELTTTGPLAGEYTTQFKSGLLGGLLGGSYGVYVQTKDGSGWTSTLAEAKASMGALGANPSCTVS